MNKNKAIELSNRYKTLLEKYGINTKMRKAMFFAQLDHESGLKAISENLNYSAERLVQIFPKYFTHTTAKSYARNQVAIANKVYANRMGNGSVDSGDGYKYRGRSFLQITGKNNYTALSKWSGVDYINNPDLLLNEADAMISSLWFWTVNNINTFSDKGDVRGATKRINGGLIGIVDRESKYKAYLQVF